MDMPLADSSFSDDRLSAMELFEIAEQVQTDAAEFYEEAAAGYPHLSNLFYELARRERLLHDRYTQLKDEFVKTKKPGKIMDDSVCRGIAALNVFAGKSDAEADFESAHSKQDVLDIILRKERDMMHYLMGLDNFLRDPTAKTILNRIIQEKKRHVAALQSEVF
ncbi:MAG: hypothetical protein JW828_10530 [Sedimentisphaerales bacterium]|nr:hypothetical protein [Sedimentisphaerales bacterium]